MAMTELICESVSHQSKACSECSQALPLEAFYAHPQGALGRMHICKECHKRRVRLRARTNPAVQEYDRARAKTPARRAMNTANTAKWRERNPLAYQAQTAVSNAVRDGKLVKEPCGICATTDHVHAHHKDYSKPLDVVWLCARCHHRLHALFPELEGANKGCNS